MDIIAGIAAATEGVKLVNELRKIDKEVDKADLKIRLVEVVDKLVDAKQALVDAQEREASLRKEIATLKESAEKRAAMRDRDGMLYEISAEGYEVGEPYCNLCFVRENKMYRLRFVPDFPGVNGDFYMAPDPAHYYCPNCKERAGG